MILKGALAAFTIFTLTFSTAQAQFGAQITSEPVTSAVVGELYQYDVEATGFPTFSLNDAPDGMTIDAQSGLIAWVPEKAGEFNVGITADALLGSDTQTFVLTVSAAPEVPVFISMPPTQARVNEVYQYDANASGNPEPDYTLTVAPTGMSIEPKTGLVSWTPGAAGDVNVTIQASNSAGSVTQAFVISVAEALSIPQITSTAVTSVTLGQDYSYDVNATGNPAPTFSLSESPTGMTIDATSGLITWAPDQVGPYPVTVVATNSQGADSQTYTLNVVEPLTRPSITSTPGLTATTGQAYSYDVNATGNPAPTYALTTSPAGMTINASTGVIAWTPSATGTFNVALRATNSQGEDTQSFSIIVSAPLVAPSITSNPVRKATAGQAYSYNVNANGNPDPVYALTSAPAGMTINSTNGVINWTPSEAGQFSITVEASNEVGSDTQTFGIDVSEPLAAPTITSTPSTQTFIGQEYSYNIEATGNPAPTYTLTSKPDDMTIDAATGVIAWMPQVTGAFNVSVRATNSQGSATQLFTINVSQSLAAPSFSSTPVETGIVNQAYRYDADAVGNPAPTYTLKTAPEGMTIAPTTGVVTWTPAAAGTYPVVIEAGNSQGTDEQTFDVVVGERLTAPAITSAPPTQTIVDLPYSYDVAASGNPAPTFALLASPAGMTIDAASGVISWTPRATGNFNVSVQAVNSQGSSSQLFTLRVENASSVAVLRSQEIEIISPTSYTFAAVISANGSPTTVTFEYGKDNVNEASILATPTPVVGIEIPIATRVDNLEEGATYLFRVVAENNAGKTTGPVQSFTTYRSSYQISADRAFGSKLDSLSYRLYSLPGDVDLNAGPTLDGVQGTDWNIYRDNGQAANYLEAFNGSSQFRFRPGRAFWMLAKTNWTVPEQTVNTVDLDRDGTYDVRLQAGWNLIGSPFLLPLPWSTVKLMNPALPATAKLWAFDGAFREATTMEPYKGYYVFNDQATALTLALPYPGLYLDAGKTDAGKTGAGKTGEASKQVAAVSGPRALRLVAATDSLASAAEIYLSDDALRGLDRLDQYAPHQAFAGLSLVVEPAFATPYGDFALEARPEIVDGAVFDLVLNAPASQRVTISTEGLAAFEDQRVVLMDRATGEMTDLHGRPTLSLPAGAAQRRYRLLVGTDAFIDDQQAELAPETFQLAPAYPNPFARSTTIEYSLVEAGDVELAVYDVLGREVDVLVRGAQPAGFHQVVWDGSNAPSGMYVLRLSTPSGPAQVRTMVKVD
ncbi:MAG: putative Ig domain-containing protein [Rhodothermales bacterium]